jgi:very-short-patch-repair endonuclease
MKGIKKYFLETNEKMGLEVCLKTDDSVVFIDIAVWYGGEKHAIEVHGDTKKIEVIDKKTESIEPHGWIVHHVFNSQIEDENWLENVLNAITASIVKPKEGNLKDII